MIIDNICKLTSAGILADRTAKTSSLGFKRYNLIYGFNGSGKSTLSRCFSSMQSEPPTGRLPEGCEFEFSTDNGETVRGGSSNVLRDRLAVFNEDFVNLNLQWSAGRARPVFYIGKEQAEAATDLKKAEGALPAAIERMEGAKKLVKAREQQAATFKRELARKISQEIRPANRKYEAPQLTSDYSTLDLSAESILDETQLEAQRELCRRDEAMPTLTYRDIDVETVQSVLRTAIRLLQETPSLTIIPELKTHSEMLGWVQEGLNYHEHNELAECLFCKGVLSPERKQLLANALDEGFARFQSALHSAKTELQSACALYQQTALTIPSPNDIVADERKTYSKAVDRLKEAISDAVVRILEPAIAAINAKLARPTLALDPDATEWMNTQLNQDLFALIDSSGLALHSNILRHNEACASFSKRQDDARLALRKHHLTENQHEHRSVANGIVRSHDELIVATDDLQELQNRIRELNGLVKEHGQAAARINRLIEAYLGHKELSIVSVEKGYEIHRRGRPIEGSPSEGEKTAIAVCYFLSTLEADGKSIRDRIVVVDDPISSLDSKALNYACSLLLSRLSDASQVFVLTHNQNCMNEFKKAWSKFYRPRKETTPSTASFLFLDVKLVHGGEARTTTIVEMSRLLREYESEYHYLADHVLKFQASNDSEYDYAYMMPNVIRRVLDVFLAFRCPGSGGFASKMEQLKKDHKALDAEKIAALERLVQLESHSDSVDDLIGFSSMTLEESKSAADSLISLMETVDPFHLSALRRLCRL
ncbi:MAG: AAA family ATPase [Rhodopseudomonas palustris]|uniref:AAA family ATPase n=1 Tax=Rhodopseudomonas palustris TaxID=1076 RepID=A0A933RY15_RHOPL|nr:AAA family ATPase [Rhodopseudomonas palustris]